MRGQAVVTDVLIAMGLLVVFLAFLLYTLSYYQDKLRQDVSFNDATQKVMQIAEVLVTSPGVPVNWSSSNVVLPGLVDGERNVSYSKLVNFSVLSDAQIKDAFHIGGYNYSFQMNYQNGSTVLSFGEAIASRSLSVSVRRMVLYGNETAYVIFSMWKYRRCVFY